MRCEGLMARAYQYPFDFAYRQEFRFDDFLAADNTQLLQFLRGFVTAPERLCFLHGTVGSGKTHLLQALCQQSASAVYLPLAQLLSYGPDTLDGLDMLDLLVVDDLQVVAGHSDWEQRLFALFNAVQAGGNHLCLAADQPPATLPLQLADLRSRLQLCLVFDVHELDDTGKLTLLRRAAARRGLELKDEVGRYILQRSARDLHSLLALLDHLDTHSLAEQRRLTQPFVKQCLGW